MLNGFINNNIFNILTKFKRPKKSLKPTKLDTITLGELLTENFIRAYTNFSTFDEMIEKSGIKNSKNSYEEVFTSTQWNKFVIKTTKFMGWDEMVEISINVYIIQEFELD